MKLLAKWDLPIRTVSEANDPSSWKNKYKRHQIQKHWIKITFRNKAPDGFTLPVHIKLTRYAPGTLDPHDNLPMSFKWVLDEICSQLIPGLRAGRADDDKRITVEYAQIRDKSFHIGIEFFDPCKCELQSPSDERLCQETSREAHQALQIGLSELC